ncbi:hypothetical protein ACFY1P_33300 [Streptomyces sp. NPDC001407]|uniref:hypothetical protein n=1 Tax=Streptomyces sp. NPDC001407 TaxID=3364573 RepID=UPI0036B684FE
MDLHALARAGSLLHRAHTALTDVSEHSARAGEPDEDQAVAQEKLDEAGELIGLARDHVLVVYALAQLRIGPPQDRSARIRDGYEALAGAADAMGVTTDGSPPRTDLATTLGTACRDMGTAVMLLAPSLGPKATAGAGPHTPVRLATHLQLFAESAGAGPAPLPIT